MVSDSTILSGPKGLNVTDENAQCLPSAQQKKKRRRRTKKGTVKSKDTCLGGFQDTPANARCRQANANHAQTQNVLCISRNKHWKYISAYHGPWLQLPVELLESLLILNLNPSTVASEHKSSAPTSNDTPSHQQGRKRGFAGLLDRNSSSITLSSSANGSSQRAPTDSPALNAYPSLPPLSAPPGKAAPPPIDPGVFRSVTIIRRLIDEAAELSVRASSGLSAAALGALQAGSGSGGGGGGGGAGGAGAGAFSLNGSAAQALGFNLLGDIGGGGGGRNVPMSANRVHRLRALAVQKLAEAYRADEIASSVMVMQRGTVFDDIAEKVLKSDPKNVDARYVHFFHEKIPSRQLAESTSTTVLDQLIAENPQRLEFYRTRGVVHCFRDEYALAVKDYSHALKEARAAWKARQAHNPSQRSNGGDSHSKSKSKRKKNKVNGQAPPDGTAAVTEGSDGEQLLLHPSVLSDAPEPIELQCLFLRASAYFSHSIYLIEEAFFKLEDVPRAPMNDFGEIQLSYIRGTYGGTEVNNPEGPLGRSDGDKARAYRRLLGEGPLRDQICALLRKSKRDHERFLAHFDSLEPPVEAFVVIDQPFDPLRKVERAFSLLDTYRSTSHQRDQKAEARELADVPLAFTTYHPLMLESHFTILICLLMLGEFEKLTSTLERTAGIVAGLEGYPVFLPPRSMAQGEFVETLERLASGWKYGKLQNALVRVQKQPIRPVHFEQHTPPAPSPLSIATDDEVAVVSSSSAGPSTSISCCSSKTSPASGRRSPLSDDAETGSVSPADVDDSTTVYTEDAQLEADRRSALEHLRFLLAPVYSRLRARTDRQKVSGDEEKKTPLSLALHSARVEFILAWLAAVHLPELEAVAIAM